MSFLSYRNFGSIKNGLLHKSVFIFYSYLSCVKYMYNLYSHTYFLFCTRLLFNTPYLFKIFNYSRKYFASLESKPFALVQFGIV